MRRSEIRDLIALTVERRYPAGDYTGIGKAAPYVEVVLGYRYVRDSFSAGVDGTLHVFHRVDFMSDVGGVPTGRRHHWHELAAGPCRVSCLPRAVLLIEADSRTTPMRAFAQHRRTKSSGATDPRIRRR
jgi:hypothetical protein